MKSKGRLGERRVMKCGEECEIVEYSGALDIVVKFLKTEELIRSRYKDFEKGEIKSHFTPTVCGAGIVGLEKTRDKNGKKLKSYQTWHHMLQRCYDEKIHLKESTYIDCTVCKEWLYYPNFKKWYEENYYEIYNEKMALDKDALNKGNKVYSPETCVFVPQRINSLFIKCNAKRGDLPIGVSYKKRDKKYQADCKIFDVKANKYKKKYLGYYNTSEEAFNVYKKTKEENIKQIADYYKDRIPEKLYKAMHRYKVEIND